MHHDTLKFIVCSMSSVERTHHAKPPYPSFTFHRESAHIRRFTSQPYARDTCQRRTSLTLANTIQGGSWTRWQANSTPRRPQRSDTCAPTWGFAPGVGKTYSMLAEGRRRAEGGERVVIGWIERHGRSETKAQLRDLEVIAPRQAPYRGSVFSELDVAGVLASGAKVVLLDELAHQRPRHRPRALGGCGRPFGRRPRRRDDDERGQPGVSPRLCGARLTGVGVVESVPDEFVRGGEVFVVPMAVDALRRRIMAGKVYSADRVGGALAEYFQASNLEALNELCGAWVADNVDEVGSELLVSSRPGQPPGRRRRCLGFAARRIDVIKTAATIARQDDADLLVVHVDVTDSSTSRQPRARAKSQL